LAVAESCTGGLLGHRITSVSGSSRYFRGGIIAYANAVKTRELGVRVESLRKEGAVCNTVVREMAIGVRRKFGVDIGIAVTGIAGPDGGTAVKPVGLVYVGLADRGGCITRECRFSGKRQRIKQASSRAALQLLRMSKRLWRWRP
jgi:nicotinamide-nucleotide amidase